ncbi:hypothetical protein [Thiocapsa sp.]|uniref:hypothetical protein n=1 Tax=Thiocapsa sp. TaxID=2024551 RepID=UPI0025E8BA90|nr:hypothetical protein [Thiocapsa sp.]
MFCARPSRYTRDAGALQRRSGLICNRIVRVGYLAWNRQSAFSMDLIIRTFLQTPTKSSIVGHS